MIANLLIMTPEIFVKTDIKELEAEIKPVLKHFSIMSPFCDSGDTLFSELSVLKTALSQEVIFL